MEIMEFGVQRLYAKEIRCKKCKRLLMKGDIWHIEIKCPKCGHIQRFGKGLASKQSGSQKGGDAK